MKKNYKVKTRIAVAFACLMTAFSASAQLTGLKNIPGDYATLSAAITDLNTQGVGPGGVTLNVISGNPETAPAGGYAITTLTGSSSSPIIIQGNGNTLTASAAHTVGALNDAIIKIIGADYVTISGFTLQENSANNVTAAASNTMTEWGIALLYASTTNGAQNISILNNTISLNRTYQNTFGIYSNSTHSATTIATSATATTTAGGNSNLVITGNNISNVNIGIVVVGPSGSADHNDGLDIGGTSSSTGNTLTNYGTTGTFSGYANVSGTVNGILVRNTKNFNVSYNTISSSVGGTSSGTLRGIFIPSFTNSPTGTVTNTINNNNISVQSGVVAGSVVGIENQSSTVNATTTLNINNNNFNSFGHTVAAATGSVTFISNGGVSLNQNINFNTFTNINLTTTGSVTFITNSVNVPAGGTQNVNNNSIVTSFNKSGAGGTVTFFTSNASSVAGSTVNNNNNNFSNITVTGATTIAGWSNTDGGSPTKFINNNIFNNITGGTNSVTIINASFGSNTLTGNSITNVNAGGAVTGINVGSNGTADVILNMVNSLSSTGASAVTGISTGTSGSLSKNKIYNFETTNAGGSVNGLLISAGTVTVSNNIIGDLKATVASGTNPLVGINVTGGTTVNLYYNTIQLFATSTGTNFGSSAVSVSTTPTVDMRNNIIINASTANGTGLTVAYRRSSTTLTTYAGTSNNNDFFAGTPSATNLIFYDGTNSDQTLASYKTRVAARDNMSVSVNPVFLSLSGASAVYLHIDPSTATVLESGGTSVSGITTDYDNDIRFGNGGYAGTGSAPDIGADEFNGTTPAPVITFTSITPGLTSQCVKANRDIVVDITTVSGTISGATLNYSYNGVAQTPVVMTNSTGNSWIGTITAPAIGNAMVSWSVTATNSLGITSTYVGTSYSDEPNTGTTALATATPTTICAGGSANLNVSLSRSPVMLGAGASTSSSTAASFLPGGWGGAKTQYLIRASELTAMGVTAGPISSLGFEPTTSGQTYTGFSLSIAPTALTALSTSFVSSGLTQVYLATGTNNGFLPVANTVNTFTFGTGTGSSSVFNWDGSSNIVLSFSWSSVPSATTSTSTTMKVDATGFTSSAYDQADSQTPAQMLASTTPDGTGTSRPKFIFAALPAASSYSWSDGSTVVGTTSSLTVSPVSSSNYTATILTNGCPVTSNTVAVTVNPLPMAPVTAGSSQCGTQVPLANVTSNDMVNGSGVFNWYAASSGGTALQSSTSATYNTAVSSTTTFYVSETGTNGCESGRTAVTVTVGAAPALTVSASQTVCNNSVAMLTVTSPTSDFDSYIWTPATNLFTDAGATIPYTGTSATTVYVNSSVAGAATYTLNANNSSTQCSNVANSTVTVLPASVSATASATTFCMSGSSVLTASPSTGLGTGSLQWQVSSDNSSFTDIGGATTATYATSALTSTTYYQVQIKNGASVCVTSPSVAINVYNPSVVSTSPGSRCGVGTVSLAAAASAGSTLNWYAASTGGAPLSTGSNFTTPSISSTTNYYVGAEVLTPGDATVGTATTLTSATSQPTAFCNRWKQYWCQMVYTAAELHAAGLGAGNITSLGFRITSFGDATNVTNFSISLGAVAGNTLTGFTTTGLTTVFSAATYNHSLGLNTMTFSTPYNWDGVSNILVDIKQVGADATNNSITYYTATTGNTAAYATTSSASPALWTSSPTASLSTQRLNATFTGQVACSGPRSLVVATVNTPPAVTVSATPATICAGESSVLDVTSSNTGYTYTWTPGSLVGSSQTVSPSGTTTYSLSAIDNSSGPNDGCATNATVTVNVTPLPSVTSATATPSTICSGGSSQLEVAGFMPRTYCAPAMTAVSASGDFIKSFTFGNISNLNSGDAANDYTYYSGMTANVVAGTPVSLSLEAGGTTSLYAQQFRIWIDLNQNGTYEVTESVYNTTSSSTSPTVVTGSVTIPVTAYNGITRMRVASRYSSAPTAAQSCIGGSNFGEFEDYNVSITGGTANPGFTYSWSPATFLSDASIANPMATNATGTTTYTVSVTASGCSATQTVTLNVNPLPTVVANSSAAAVCQGGSVTLTGSGATSYTWSGTVADGVAFTPTGTDTYTVTGTDANGCMNTATTTVTVNPLPTVVANASAATICQGGSVTLTGSGATSYTWSGTVADGVAFTPTGTDTYTVTGTDANGCMNTATTTVTVNPLPTVLANSSAAAVCQGGSVTLTGGGATSYTWSGTVADGVAFTPTSTDTYTVTGTDANGCMNTATTTVTVNPLPTVVANSSAAAVCQGGSVTLTGNGATSYTWSGTIADGVAFTPTATDTYTVTGTDANGCMNTATATVTVNPLPTVTASSNDIDNTVCAGTSVTLTGSGASTYTWSGTTTVTDNTPFTPTASDTYTVIGTDANGCSDTATIMITVNSLPVVVLGADMIECGSATLDAQNAGATYMWSDMSTAQTLTVTSSGTYYVTVNNGSCSASDTISVTINTLPSVTMTPFVVPVCDNAGPIALSGGSPAGGVYSGTAVTAGIFDPTGLSGAYLITYTVTDANSCTNSDTATIMVDVCNGIASASSAEMNINVYPNPTEGMFNINITNARFNQFSVSIVDIQGKEVYSHEEKNNSSVYNKQVDLEGFAKGVYYIKMYTDRNIKIQKLVIH